MNTIGECVPFIYFDINYQIGLCSEEDDALAFDEFMGLCG